MNTKEITIDFSNPREAAIKMITLWESQLIDARGETDYPEELEWEIRLYQFMLKDPESRLAAYGSVRFRASPESPLVTKREAVRRLGWDIP